MVTCKTVWFCESDPERWFKRLSEAEEFDKVNEIISFIKEGCNSDSPQVEHIVERLMIRYEIRQRWDYKEPEGEQE